MELVSHGPLLCSASDDRRWHAGPAWGLRPNWATSCTVSQPSSPRRWNGCSLHCNPATASFRRFHGRLARARGDWHLLARARNGGGWRKCSGALSHLSSVGDAQRASVGRRPHSAGRSSVAVGATLLKSQSIEVSSYGGGLPLHLRRPGCSAQPTKFRSYGRSVDSRDHGRRHSRRLCDCRWRGRLCPRTPVSRAARGQRSPTASPRARGSAGKSTRWAVKDGCNIIHSSSNSSSGHSVQSGGDSRPAFPDGGYSEATGRCCSAQAGRSRAGLAREQTVPVSGDPSAGRSSPRWKRG